MPEPVENTLLLVAFPLVPLSTVLWANAAPAQPNRRRARKFLIFYFRRRIAANTVIPATINKAPAEGSGTCVTVTAFT
jgi:hypothetical protein